MRRHRPYRPVALLALAGLFLALVVAVPGVASGRAVQRGICETSLVDRGSAARRAAIHDMAVNLKAKVFRHDVFWTRGEPQRGVYDDAGYLGGIKDVVDTAKAEGMTVILTIYNVPRWASDASFWGSASFGPGYQPYYPVAGGSLDDLQRFTAHLATLTEGKVDAWECWNEPNLWPYIYPQYTQNNERFAATEYIKYFRRVKAGALSVDPDAKIVAGSTAPIGTNDKLRTSPLRFAKWLKLEGLRSSDFDAYSHHPYVPGLSRNMNPTAKPTRPKTTVSLANIGPLLRLFPGKPFYLTEYGYSTHRSVAFGPPVSMVQQAAWLKTAYAMAARHPQIKLMTWYLERDWSPNGKYSNGDGVYTGLRTLGGTAKRSYYSFAGGNHLSLLAPPSVRKGASARLSGRLWSDTLSGLRSKPLTIQRKRGTGAWRTVKTVTSGADGAYRASVRVSDSARYRVTFQGVVTSPSRAIRAR